MQCEQSFLQVLFVKEKRIAMIEGYHRRLDATVASFQVSRVWFLASD